MPESNFKVKREKLTAEEYEIRKKEVLQRDGYRCRICHKMTNLDVDHIKKRSQGGGDEMTNLRTLCRDCHDKEDNSTSSSKRKKVELPLQDQ